MTVCERCGLEPGEGSSVDLTPPGTVCANCDRVLAATVPARAHVIAWRAAWTRALAR